MAEDIGRSEFLQVLGRARAGVEACLTVDARGNVIRAAKLYVIS
jgi:hypothetical protein